jgi:hypothetical protein
MDSFQSRLEAAPTYSSSICGSGFQPREIHHVELFLFFLVSAFNGALAIQPRRDLHGKHPITMHLQAQGSDLAVSLKQKHCALEVLSLTDRSFRRRLAKRAICVRT